MNPSKLPPLDSIRDKIHQGESLSITEKLQLIWDNKPALVIAVIFGLIVPGLVLNFKLKAEHFQSDAGQFLGMPAPVVVWIVLTGLLGFVSLNSLFSTYGLMVPHDRRSNVIRGIICLSVEIAWLAIDPVWLTGRAADWYELILVSFLLLLIIFSNVVAFGGWITEWQTRRDKQVWGNSQAARDQQYKDDIEALRRELENAQDSIYQLRHFFDQVQQMADACPAGPSGSSVLDIKRRKEPSGACRHEIVLREADVKRTGCEDLGPVVLSDPLLDLPTVIGQGSTSSWQEAIPPIVAMPMSDLEPEAGSTREVHDNESLYQARDASKRVRPSSKIPPALSKGNPGS